jgi:energy-coupling factor transport system ATP-binding protein
VDERPAGGRESVRGAVGLVFQRPEAQFFALSVEEDCAFGPRNLGRSAADALSDAHAALATVGLDPHVFGSRDPWGLSGGEARRAALAGVLAMRPRYLLLDEPTAGLDAAGRAAVLAAVVEARRGAGVLVVTHDPEEFLADADVVLVLLDGRTAYAGNVAGLLEALPALDAAGIAEPGEVVRAQLLAEARGVRLDGPIALDPVAAAGRLARAAGER